jgi:hypothetical protein
MPDAGGVCSSVYRKPAEVSTEDLSIMALNDRHYLARPYYGSRRMAAWLATQGHVVNRKLVEALSNYGRPEIFDTEQSLPSRKRRESGGQPVHQRRVHRHAEAAWDHDQHGRPEMLWGEQREKGIIVAANNRRDAPCRSPRT